MLRRRLTMVGCAWLACHLALVIATPLSLLADMPASLAAACTCTHAGSGECPMHHPAPRKNGCECRSTTNPEAAAIVSMLGPAAVLSDAPTAAAPIDVASSPRPRRTAVSGFRPSPTAPPPRA